MEIRLIKFDHLVHFTYEPEKVMNIFTNLGLRSIKGGKHPNWGTYNCLSYFQGLRYIEWIGFTNRDVAMSSTNPLIRQIVEDSENGEGFTQIAFRTDDIHTLKCTLEKKGFKTIGPFHGNRQTEEGTRLSWSMLFINEEKDKDIRLPFFIQWGQKDEFRLGQIMPLLQHENGTTSLSFIGYSVKNAERILQKFSSILDCELTSVQEKIDPFGSYHELSIKDFSLRFYNQTKIDSKPFICGLTGIQEEKTLKINGGYYTFLK